MIETENKVYARRCESHVEALRRAVPGCIEKVEWQCEDQLTITVKQDKLPGTTSSPWRGRTPAG